MYKGLVEPLQAEIYRLWHEVGPPDTDGWQAWPLALAAVIAELARKASPTVKAIGKREAGTWTVEQARGAQRLLQKLDIDPRPPSWTWPIMRRDQLLRELDE